MPIVSVSLTEKNMEALEKIQELLGLAGRSEAIRVCLRSAETEAREREGLVGNVEESSLLFMIPIIHRNWMTADIDTRD